MRTRLLLTLQFRRQNMAILTCSSHATVPSPPQASNRKLGTLRKRCSTSRGSSWLRSDTCHRGTG